VGAHIYFGVVPLKFKNGNDGALQQPIVIKEIESGGRSDESQQR
jgi:hypothetical protein